MWYRCHLLTNVLPVLCSRHCIHYAAPPYPAHAVADSVSHTVEHALHDVEVAETKAKYTLKAMVLCMWTRPLLPALEPLVSADWFDGLVMAVVLVNTGVLACDR